MVLKKKLHKCKMISNKICHYFPATDHAIHAISGKEPTLYKPSKQRSYSLINALVYSVRIFTDPLLNVCFSISKLVKVFYCLSRSEPSSEVKIEAFKVLDYVILSISSIAFNFILASKCVAGVINPKITYKKASEKETRIINKFNEYKKKANELAVKGVKEMKSFKTNTHSLSRMKKLKQASEKTRKEYFLLKIYTI